MYSFCLLFITLPIFHCYKSVLYAHGLFQTPNLTKSEDIIEIAQSGFETIILWTIHVDKHANLIYNDDIIVSVGRLNHVKYGKHAIDIQSRISELRSTPNSSVIKILFGIGSGGPPTDFANLVHVYNKPALKFMLFMNFRVLIDLGVDGFDYDCEEFRDDIEADDPMINVIVDMVTRFNAMPNGASIQTFVPYDNIDAWMECLKRIYKNNGKQLINWLNVQCYSGGDYNKKCLQSMWIDRVNTDAQLIGVPDDDGAKYIVPGFDAMIGVRHIEYEFWWYASAIVEGGFIWNWKDRTQQTNVKDFYEAMMRGLEYRSGCTIS